jgi:hypothetical protein
VVISSVAVAYLILVLQRPEERATVYEQHLMLMVEPKSAIFEISILLSVLRYFCCG